MKADGRMTIGPKGANASSRHVLELAIDADLSAKLRSLGAGDLERPEAWLRSDLDLAAGLAGTERPSDVAATLPGA